MHRWVFPFWRSISLKWTSSWRNVFYTQNWKRERDWFSVFPTFNQNLHYQGSRQLIFINTIINDSSEHCLHLTKTFIFRGANGGDPREQCQRTTSLLLAFSHKHPLAPCLLTFLDLFHPSRQNSCLLVERTMKRQQWFNGTEEVTPSFLNVIFETIHWFFFHSFWFVSSGL